MAGKDLKIALQIKADLDQARRELNKFNKEILEITHSAEQATSSQNNMSQSTASNADEISRLQQETLGLADSISRIDSANDLSFGRGQFDEYGSVVDDVAGILEDTEEKAANLNDAADQVLPSLVKLAAALGGIQLGINLVDSIDEWGQYDVRIKNATASEAEYITVKQRLLETANSTFRPLQEAQELYIRTSKAVKDLGYDTDEMLDITDSFSYLLVTNAASADKAQSALDAYSKSITKNKVEADAWESIVTAMPSIVTSIAQASNKTEAEIRRMGTEGTLSLRDLNEGLRKTVDANKELAAGMDNTRKDALQALTNNFVNLLGEFNKTYQVTQTLSAGIIFLSDNIELVTAAAAGLIATALSKYLITVALAAGANAKALYQQITATGAAVQAERARSVLLLQIARANALVVATEVAASEAALASATASGASATALAAAHARVAQAKLANIGVTEALSAVEANHARIMTGSALSARALGAALFGPVGLAIGIGAVVTGFLSMRDSSAEAQTGLEAQTKTVTDLAEEYKKLDESQQRIALRKAIQEQTELTQAYDEQSKKLIGLIEIGIQAYNVSDEQREKAERLIVQYKLGKITANQLATEFQKMDTVQQSVRNHTDELADSSKKSKESLDRQNIIVDAYTGKASTASITTYDLNNKIEDTSIKAKTAAGEINKLSKEWQNYIKTTQSDTLSNDMQLSYMTKGLNDEKAKTRVDAYNLKNSDPNATQTFWLNSDDLQKIETKEKSEQRISDFNEKQKKQEEAKTKEKEKQVKLAITQKAIEASTNEQTKNMLMVYQGYIKAGATDSMARYLTSEVGREGDFLSKNIFGSHQDKNNGYTNTGILSYQKTRSKDLMAFLKSKGLLDAKGNIKQSQESVDAQTEFSMYELLNKKEYGKSKDALLNGNSWESLQQVVGKNLIGWDIAGNKLSQNEVAKAQGRQLGYKKKLDQLLGADPSALLGEFSKLSSVREDFAKVEEEQDKNRISLRESLWTDEEKKAEEHAKKLKEINEAGFDDTERNELLAKENNRYEEALSKRPEILKRVQDSLSGLNKDWLKASGNDLDATLMDVDEKWKQPRADIASLLMSESNPTQANEYQQMLVKIDFVIDQEKLTLQYNDAVERFKQLDELRNSRLDNLKVQFDSGQITQPQYAEQAKEINEQLRPEMENLIELAWQYADAMQGVSGERARENTLAMQQSLIETNNEFRKFLPTAEQLNEQIAGGLTDSIMAWVDGTKSAGDAFRQFASDFLREIAQMILKQMLFNAISQMGAAAGAASGAGGTGGMIAGALLAAFGAGYMDGGHTGYGARNEVAGVVHKDEWVITKLRTNEPGAKQFLAYFEQYGMQGLNKFKGYANGGLVGAPQVNIPNLPTPKVADPAAMIANSTSFSANQNFYLVDDPARILDILKSGASQENLVVMMSRDPAKFKSALKIG